MNIKLISRKRFRDYDVTGYGNIYRAAVPYGIKPGQYFNIYRGESTKNGCLWMGSLDFSLLKLLAIESSN